LVSMALEAVACSLPPAIFDRGRKQPVPPL
jgi:hypothetical protein